MTAQRPEIAVLGARGRIGELLCRLGADAGYRVHPITRDADSLGLGAPGPAVPIVVCTRNDDLDVVVPAVHPSRRRDLVFVQNGMVQPWLRARGLGDNTQGVLYVAVPKVGAPPVPGGPSVFWGPWAEPVVTLLDQGGVDAAVVDRAGLQREVAVKLAWICVFSLIGSVTGAGVGAICADHADDVAALTRELHPLLVTEAGLDLDADALTARSLAYGRRIPHFSARVKEWRWRNGWVVSAAESRGMATPLHGAWLARMSDGEG